MGRLFKQLGVSRNDGRLRTICRGHPPLDGCEHLLVSSEVGFPKPTPRFYRRVEEQLGLWPEQILLIGDDYDADVAGLQSAGWKTMWLRRDEMQSWPAWVRSLWEIDGIKP